MKLTKLLISVLLFSTTTYGNIAQSDPVVKAVPSAIAIIDPQTILTESKAAKSIREQIEKKRTEYQNQISVQEKELNKKKQDLESLQGKVAEAELNKKAQIFNAEVAKVQRNVQDKRVQLDQAYATAVAEIEKSVTGIMKKLATEKGFDIIMPSTGTMFVNDNVLNITQEAIRLLDEQLPKVNVVTK